MGLTQLRKRKASLKEEARLTDKMRAFIAEYLVDFNGKRAAIAAGYSPKTAQIMGSKLLKHPVIAKIVGNARQENATRLNLERENVLLKLSQNLNRNLWDLGDENGVVVSSLRDIPPQAHPYIDGFEVRQVINPETGEVVGQKIKIRLSPNAAAQDMAMKFIGAYAAEKHVVSAAPVIDYDLLLRKSEDVEQGRIGQPMHPDTAEAAKEEQ